MLSQEETFDIVSEIRDDFFSFDGLPLESKEVTLDYEVVDAIVHWLRRSL